MPCQSECLIQYISVMRFKLWLQTNENIGGPGGGPDWSSIDLVRYYRDIASKEAGAFPQGGDNPPKSGVKSPTADYLSPAHRRKLMLKRMKKMKAK